MEGSAEHGSGRTQERTEKTSEVDEQLLFDIEAHLAKAEELEHIKSVRPIAEIYAKGQSQFVTGVLRFRWAHTHSMDLVADAIKKEMVEFELDRDSHDDADMLGVPFRMGGSLEKCVSRKTLSDGNFSPTSHLAFFLRQLAGHSLPLGFFGLLQPLSGMIYLKPYAIWFP